MLASIISATSAASRHTLDLKTAPVIATSLVHSKLYYCNSLPKLTAKQLSRHQLLQNSLSSAVTVTPKTEHITPTLKSLCWLKIEERIHYKSSLLRPSSYLTTPISQKTYQY